MEVELPWKIIRDENFQIITITYCIAVDELIWAYPMIILSIYSTVIRRDVPFKWRIKLA
jgi:hypothetical protein